ncbi:DUF4893 domain-containing protein [Brevundimonas pishanensis]|uniref:DUF4893 domain-containing protein n=1 Tax=Brevundimonas pishanensis TaxID=2896315 RepID=UPI001FA7178B|nr:DUF4893 domain-containing protein [Brevundimonas pishanensis]
MTLHPALSFSAAALMLMMGGCEREPAPTTTPAPPEPVVAPPLPETTTNPLAAAEPAQGLQGGTDDWQKVMSAEDKDRMARLNQAWSSALKSANSDVENRGAIKALSALARPDAALEGRLPPPPGTYRCRTLKLGSRGAVGLDYVAYPYFRCRVELTAGGDLILEKVSGSQRFKGLLYPDTNTRLVYVGTQAWGDEQGFPTYGQQPERDESGVLERIGPSQWRLVIPFPKQESRLNIIEIVR